jgi:rhamnogalacturonyl hydrolase YesR
MPDTNKIDIFGKYSVRFGNGQLRTLDGRCLLHNYLRDKLNRASVVSYQREEGAWYDIFVSGSKFPGVYATSETAAIDMHLAERTDAGIERSTVCAVLSQYNNGYETITLSA